MKDWVYDIALLRHAYGQPVPHSPCLPDVDAKRLSLQLVVEEFEEFEEAVLNDDIPQIAKEGIDLIVVTLGAMIAHGIDPRPVWELVHRSNMSKANGPVRADGKRLKPEGYIPPNIEAEMIEQGWVKTGVR